MNPRAETPSNPRAETLSDPRMALVCLCIQAQRFRIKLPPQELDLYPRHALEEMLGPESGTNLANRPNKNPTFRRGV